MKRLTVDTNIVDAIALFFKYKLPPGSCTTLLLQGRYEEAKQQAHPHVRDRHWQDHVDFVECLPFCFRKDNFATWEGYAHLSVREAREVDVLIALSCSKLSVVYQWMEDLNSEFIV